MWDFPSAAERIRQLRRIVRLETIRLVVLTTIAVAAFLGTHALARRAEHLELQDAAAWYERGRQHLAEGHPDAAAIAFRRATLKHRGEKRYVLGLADALVRSGSRDAATRALLSVREFNPEDAEVNLSLARLARDRGEVNEAIRYYQHAIYAPGSTVAASRHLRLELVELLIETRQTSRAAAELVAASTDAPDDAAERLRIGDLFLRAGAPLEAARHYEQVLKLEPKHLGALEGAVRARFALADYRRVAGVKLPETASTDARDHVAVAREVLSRDPLASRLPAAERRRRLLRNVSHLEERWRACTPTGDQGRLPAPLLAVQTAARNAAVGRDTEALETSLTRLDEMRQQLDSTCADAGPVDRALAIIATRHGLNAS